MTWFKRLGDRGKQAEEWETAGIFCDKTGNMIGRCDWNPVEMIASLAGIHAKVWLDTQVARGLVTCIIGLEEEQRD